MSFRKRLINPQLGSTRDRDTLGYRGCLMAECVILCRPRSGPIYIHNNERFAASKRVGPRNPERLGPPPSNLAFIQALIVQDNVL